MSKMVSQKKLVQPIQKALLDWYRVSHRDLPWRNTRDPYEVWISEIMLQQTQVETVLPYYARFLERFPTVEALAKASQDEVLKLWEGLGYYARARNLHRAAKEILERYDGQFPKEFAAIHGLMGIGQSTAGAISTFAFAIPMPILDGNVKRVLSRLKAVQESIDDKTVIDSLWQISEELLPRNSEDAYAFNQAIMELGATCCTPKQPSCDICPWASLCETKQKGLQEEIPLRAKKKISPHYTIGVGVVFNDKNQVLIALRPEDGLLGGLWEFPGGKCQDHESLAECVKREIKEETDLIIEVETQLVTVKHAYTHFKITLHAFRCKLLSGKAQAKASQKLMWVELSELAQYAFPKANHAILTHLALASESSVIEQGVLF